MNHAFRTLLRRASAHRPTFLRLRIATVFVAAYALLAGASAQIVLKGTGQGGSASAVVQTEQVRAELIAHAPDGIDAGKTVWLGLQIQHQPHWHTYWTNPGDSGLPTMLQWTLPAGVTAGDIAWPTPKRIPIGSLANFGYEDTVLLPVPVTVGQDFKAGPSGLLEVGLNANWLVCRQECIPQEGKFVLRLPTRGSTAAQGGAFAAAHAASPRALTGTSQATLRGDALVVTVTGLPTSWNGRALLAFPETAHIAEPVKTPQTSDAVANTTAADAKPATQAWSQGVWTAHFPLSTQRESAPTSMPLVLALGNESLRSVATISGTWPALPGAGTPTTATPVQSTAAATTSPAGSTPDSGISTSWGMALMAALLGGLILNLMPCVLPVLAIKVLSFATSGAHSRATQRAQGVAYTAGVVLSFMALGGLMLGLRASGEQLGWGFHLQSPAVVTVLAALFTLLALNLAGLFEVGNMLPQRVACAQARHPVIDAFLSGVLAVAIASPCTAPFMGASLGYAISLPAFQALSIFAALGLGLALPFLAASWVPAVGRWLPRPGAWMDTLRRFMAFPMLATVVWLVWVLGHLTGVNGAGALLALLVCLSFLVWSLRQVGRSRTVFVSMAVLALLGFMGSIGPLVLMVDDSPSNAATSASTGGATQSAWQAWAPGKVEAELAAGRPVFVDFTAAWCITCQYNKKTTLGSAAVLADMKSHNVTLLRADWTRRDPAITVALEALGRSGVPVYVLHQAGKPPVVFSEILDAQALRAALASL